MPPQAYDHPAFLARHQFNTTGIVGSIVVQGRFQARARMRIRSASARILTAGTSASPGGAIRLSKVSGTTTTSIGDIPTGTVAANGSAVMADLGLSVGILGADDMLYVANGTDATMVAAAAIEWEFLPDAVLS